MAPERIMGKINDKYEVELAKADMWSVGAIIYTLIFGKTPFQGETIGTLVKHLKKCKLPDLNGYKKRATPAFLTLLELVSELLNPDPIDRLDVAQAINHEFFNKGKFMPDFYTMQFTLHTLVAMKITWRTLVLKDSIKSYFNFVKSANKLSAAFEVIFTKNKATNMK